MESTYFEGGWVAMNRFLLLRRRSQKGGSNVTPSVGFWFSPSVPATDVDSSCPRAFLAQYSQGSLCNGGLFVSIGKRDRSWNTRSISTLLPGFVKRLVLLSTADRAHSECGAAEICNWASEPGNCRCSENVELTLLAKHLFTRMVYMEATVSPSSRT